MMALFEQAVYNFVRGVICIGDKIIGIPNGEDTEQSQHFVEQGAPIPIGPNQALMNAHGQRYSEDALSRRYEDADGLQGVSHNVFGFGV